MNLRQIPLFSMLTQQMTWLNARQKVLAQNIANADTPNYVPSDLVRLDFADMAKASSSQIKLKITSASHLKESFEGSGQFKTFLEKGFEAAPSGNSVVLEEQMMKVSESQIDFELITRLYRRHVGMLRTALGRSN